jgi:transposase, IS30 family
LSKDYSLRSIAFVLKRSVSTISDEIKRNSVKGEYDPLKAHQKAYARRHNASYRGIKIVSNDKLREFVEISLVDNQTPPAISGRLRFQEKHLPYVSKNTIYDFLDSPYGKLIREKRKKRKYYGKSRKVDKLKDRRFVDKRPKVVTNRARTGDCEGDFIVSGKRGSGFLLVVIDRKIRVAFLELITDVSVDNVHLAFLKIKKRFPMMKTLTLDNDILFKMHKALEKLLEVNLYFCHPYHSWEKGSVENVNRYIRNYIPKGSNLSRYDKDFILSVEQKCNQRFMQCLKFKTPEEKLEEYYKRIKKQRGRR